MKEIKFNSLSLQYPIGTAPEADKDFAKQAAKAFKKLYKFKGKSIQIICRGSSGSMLAALFASNLKQNVIIRHIKKEGEYSHTSPVPYFYSDHINVMIDDFMTTGETLRTIYEKFSERVDRDTDIIHCLIIQHGYREGRLNFVPEYLLSHS